MPTVDAIIPVHAESPENLFRTLEGLRHQDRAATRILVVDDASPVPVLLPGIGAPVEVIRLAQNAGISAARNYGAAESSAEYLLFVNCDVVLRPNWLGAALGFMDDHLEVAAVGGSIAPAVGSRTLRDWRMRFLENPEQRGKERRRVAMLNGHAVFVRRMMFDEIGGFDARFALSQEDFRFSQSLISLGHEIYYLPELVADSYEMPSVDLLARKSLRNDGWDPRRRSAVGVRSEDVRPVQPLPATASVISSFINHFGRNLAKRRVSFLPVDIAVAAKSLVLVWGYANRAARVDRSYQPAPSVNSRSSCLPQIVILTMDFPPAFGGIQRLTYELASRLASTWSVTVIAPHDPGADEYDSNVPFRVLRTRVGWKSHRPRFFLEMARLAAASPGDIFVAAHVNTLVPLMASHPHARKVAIFHGSELWAPASRLVARTLAPHAHQVMAVSRFTASEAEKVGVSSDRISLTPPGADLPVDSAAGGDVLDRLGLTRDSEIYPFFLTVSRLDDAHKGQDIFLRALPEILARHPDVRYVIAGEGRLGPDFRRLATELGVWDAVRMPGGVDEAEKASLMRACRAYVMLSREVRKPALFEGFGIAYIEAALAGRPSIAGDSGGVADAVVDGQTGLLVDPLSVRAASDAAIRLLDNPAYADGLGEAARERAESEFTWEAAVARMERVLQEALPRAV